MNMKAGVFSDGYILKPGSCYNKLVVSISIDNIMMKCIREERKSNEFKTSRRKMK